MLTDKQFISDALWRSLRTFCQTLYGLLVVVQVKPDVQIPWQGYLYVSGIAALTSLLQSIGRERVANSVRATEKQAVEASPPPTPPAAPAVAPPVAVRAVRKPDTRAAALGCGDSLR